MMRPVRQDALEAFAEAPYPLSVSQLLVRMRNPHGHPETHRAVLWLRERGLVSEPQPSGARVFEITKAGREACRTL